MLGAAAETARENLEAAADVAKANMDVAADAAKAQMGSMDEITVSYVNKAKSAAGYKEKVDEPAPSPAKVEEAPPPKVGGSDEPIVVSSADLGLSPAELAMMAKFSKKPMSPKAEEGGGSSSGGGDGWASAWGDIAGGGAGGGGDDKGWSSFLTGNKEGQEGQEGQEGEGTAEEQAGQSLLGSLSSSSISEGISSLSMSRFSMTKTATPEEKAAKLSRVRRFKVRRCCAITISILHVIRYGDAFSPSNINTFSPSNIC
jgi:hypothetical protein